MGAINLEDLRPGMVRARDAMDLNGRILLAAGTELTDKHLRVFKIWGVTEAEVQGVDKGDVVADITTQVDPEIARKAEEDTHKLFSFVDTGHPAMEELMRLVIARLVRVDSGRRVEHE